MAQGSVKCKTEPLREEVKVEPLHPSLRQALKLAHPGLTDHEIDKSEELLAQRMLCNPQTDAARIEKLDQERTHLIKTKMPHYAQVAKAFNAGEVKPERPSRKVTVTPKKRPP